MSSTNPPVLIIRSRAKLSWDDIIDIWRFRELLYFLTWRDIKVRYKQTAIGILWALIQPFITMVVFSIFFGNFVKVPSDGIPYPIFVYVGLLLWQFFQSSLTATSNCLIGNAGIVTKIYFPRLILPISSSLTHAFDFMIASVMLVFLMIYYQYLPNLAGLWILPLLLLLSFMIAVGAGLILASVNVKYRDIKFILPFFIQMLLFLTPVIYPSSILNKYSWLMAINPMTGVINSARAAILGNAPINWLLLSISAGAGLVLLIIGVMSFKRTERYFADII